MPWGGLECYSCRSISTESLPSEEDLEAYYKQFNKEQDGEGNLLRYAKKYLSEVERLVKRGRLIDIGPSLSPFPNLAYQAGCQVTIIDYVRAKTLHPWIDCIIGNLNNDKVLEEVEQAFDIVCCFAIIEHCLYPDLACKIISKLCKPGGLIFIMTPEIGTFSTTWALSRSGWFHPPMHLFLLSKKALVGGDRRAKGTHLRRGIRLFEGGLGLFVRSVNRRLWENLRVAKVQKYKGIALYVFEKRNGKY